VAKALLAVSSFCHIYLPASSARQTSGIGPDGVLLSTLQYFLVEGGCWQRWQIGNPTLHVVSMPVGGEMRALLIGRLEGDLAGYAGKHIVVCNKSGRWKSKTGNTVI
jgi:hypothetical protein